MNIELVTFPICPFGQRPLITLLQTGVDHQLTYIRPDALPEWFATTSPLGKVPLMRVGESDVLFESSVISEFVNDLADGDLLPAAPLERATARTWIEFASALLGDLFALVTASQQEAFDNARRALIAKLGWLERHLGGSRLFLGDTLSLVDSALGPLFQRLLLLDSIEPWLPWADLPRCHRYAQALAEDPVISRSLPDGFESHYRGFIGRQGGHAASLFAG